MLQLTNVSLAFGDQKLFQGLTWHIRQGDRVGLVGPNGAGKTTLFRLLTATVEPDEGSVHLGKGTKIGYLPQEGIEISGRNLFSEAQAALPELAALQQELAVLQEKLEILGLEINPQDDGKAQDELISRLGNVQTRIEELGGFKTKATIAKILSGLGFHEAQFTAQTETFSGGWQMRIALAKLLLQEPDVLLLDEPTNHLDLDSLVWLESYLRTYRGSVVIISHDRAFLDRLVNRVALLQHQTITEYVGNYSSFEKTAAEQALANERAYENQQDEIQRLTRFINTFRYNARKAPQVQSRIKQLEKMRRLDAPTYPSKGVHFQFPAAKRSGKRVLTLDSVEKRYGNNKVFTGLELTIERGDRIALVGANGSGKSTLSRILAGIEAPTLGTRQLGHQVTLDYYAQQQAERLQTSNTVYEEVLSNAATEIVPQIRTLLGAFLFSADTVDKRVGVLSGGEKSRLALAKMLLQSSNMLVLDEPTNHLDIRTKDILKEALTQYTGTFVVVSHDRYFLKGLVTKVVELAEGSYTIYPGTFEEFLDWKTVNRPEPQHSLESNSQKREQGRTSKGSPPNHHGIQGALAAIHQAKHGQTSYQRQKAERAERHKRAKRLTTLEQTIAHLEEKKATIEGALADDQIFRDHAKAQKVNADYSRVKETLREQYAEWTALAEEHEAE